MPKTAIPQMTVVPQRSVVLLPVAVDIANGNMFLNDGSCLLYVSNPAGGVCDVTVTAVPDEAGRTGTQTTPTGYSRQMAAGEISVFGPFRQAWWNQTSTDVGSIYVTLSRATAVACIINY